MKTTPFTSRRAVRVAFLLAIGLSAGFTTGCSGRVSDRSIEPIAISDVSRRLQKSPKATLVLDARDRDAFARGHLPGARHTSLSEIDLTDTKPRFGGYDMVVVYGQNPGSGTARALVKRLLQTGHKKVALLENGYDGWVEAGLGVER